LGRGRWGFSWGLKERDIGGRNGGGVERAAASWWRGQLHGGEGSGLEARGFQRERGICVLYVERAAATWWRGRRHEGEGNGLEAEGFQRERERNLCFVFLILFI
jgi:hypothetical protein